MEVDNDDVEGAFFSLCTRMRSGNGKKRSKGCATEAEVTTTNKGGGTHSLVKSGRVYGPLLYVDAVMLCTTTSALEGTCATIKIP